MREPLRTVLLLAIAMGIAASYGVPVCATKLPRIELLREVQVTGTRILLSDLLPKDAAAPLRTSAGEISLGAAPQPGNTRVLDRGGVLEEIGDRPGVAENISVPDEIVVSRNVRPITVAEVLTALQTALESSGLPAGVQLRPEDVVLQSQVLVGPGEAGLEVLRAGFDPALRRGRFLLWASKSPGVLPFFVVVRFAKAMPSADFALMKEGKRTVAAPISQAAAVSRPKAEFLVLPGEPATLVLHSAGMQMVADVLPLEKGVIGQRVRVRVADTGKIFSAAVNGRGHLELSF